MSVNLVGQLQENHHISYRKAGNLSITEIRLRYGDGLSCGNCQELIAVEMEPLYRGFLRGIRSWHCHHSAHACGNLLLLVPTQQLKAFTIFCAPAGLTAAENVEHPTGFAN